MLKSPEVEPEAVLSSRPGSFRTAALVCTLDKGSAGKKPFLRMAPQNELDKDLNPGHRRYMEKTNKTALLLINTGSPDAATVKAVRRYLAEFLGDRRIVELPRWKWWPILHGIILRTRPKKSAERYKSVWTDEGSPLIVHTKRTASALEAELGLAFP